MATATAAASYVQTERPFIFGSDAGENKLLVQRFSGEEGVSTPFHFTVDLLSTDAGVSGESLVRSEATVKIQLTKTESPRVLHGRINRFVSLGPTGDKMTAYRAELVPWLWFLSLSSDCRTFQNKSVPEIVKDIFDEAGFTDYDIPVSRPVRRYCVQYRESHLDFVSRLLEEEGIYYWFEHSASKHTLKLGDTSSAAKAGPGGAKVRMVTSSDESTDNALERLEREHSARTGKVTLADYNPLDPSADMRPFITGKHKEEIYDYPGGFEKRAEGDRYARLRLEERESLQLVVRGEGSCRHIQSGAKVEVDGAPGGKGNGSYFVLRVWHSGTGGSLLAGGGGGSYRSRFMGIPLDVPYRPPRVTPRPKVFGSQTAVVVGKGSEEIDADEHARVFVQFHWDRKGAKDEKSSLPVRVASTWAGKGWGFIQIPRIGQEVLVDFLEGDPDRPIITGRVYNKEQMPPYDLPAHLTQSGVKSRSSKDGDATNFNEIRFEDQKGSEEVYIHAEKDKKEVVENDNLEEIGHDENISVKHDQVIGVDNDQSITIGKNRTESVGEDESISIGKSRSETVGDDETVNVGKDRSHTVGKDESLTVSGKRDADIGKSETVTIGENRTTKVGKVDNLDVGKKLVITAADEVSITVGSSTLTMKKNGEITVNGKDLTFKGSGKINVKASSDLVLKGSKIAAN